METKRRELDNIRFPKPGRPKGVADIHPKVKAEIVAHKNLHLLSQPSIAKKFNVSRQTVVTLTEDKLNPEARKHLYSFVDKLSDIREETADVILEKIRNRTIKDGVLPTLLNIANQNYRLETDQSTANINVQNHVSIIQNWIQRTSPNPELIAKSIEAIADKNGLNAQELRLAVMGELDTPNG